MYVVDGGIEECGWEVREGWERIEDGLSMGWDYYPCDSYEGAKELFDSIDPQKVYETELLTGGKSARLRIKGKLAYVVAMYEVVVDENDNTCYAWETDCGYRGTRDDWKEYGA